MPIKNYDEKTNTRESLMKMLTFLVAITAVFMIFKTVGQFKTNAYIGYSGSNLISFTGEGEVFAPADIATFSVTVTEDGDTSSEAQDLSAKKINKVIDYLKAQNIEDKDIQTSGYNIYPRYEWRSVKSVDCGLVNCPTPDSTRVLVGYEATQTITVKVRDIQKAGDLLSGVGGFNVNNLSGLTFSIDDENTLKREARQKAIDDAKTKAEELSKDLGVKLVRIANFNEGGVYPYYTKSVFDSATMASGMGGATAEAPQLPVGENRIVSNVTITYEIR